MSIIMKFGHKVVPLHLPNLISLPNINSNYSCTARHQFIYYRELVLKIIFSNIEIATTALACPVSLPAAGNTNSCTGAQRQIER
jgi:hypothetical protein